MGTFEAEMNANQTTTATTTTLTAPTRGRFLKNSRTVKKQSAKMCRSLICTMPLIVGGLLLLLGPAQLTSAADEAKLGRSQANEAPSLGAIRSTQASVDRQVDAPNSAPVVSWSAPSVSQPVAAAKEQQAPVAPEKASEPAANKLAPAQAYKPKQMSGSQRKSALASQQNYDKYQLKASNSNYHSQTEQSGSGAASAANSASSAEGESAATTNQRVDEQSAADKTKPAAAAAASVGGALAHKKAGHNTQQAGNNKPKSASSSFSLLKKFLPSFMTSSGSMAAAAAAASAMVDKHQLSHSRSSQSSPLSAAGDGPLARASGKIINLLSSKKAGSVPDHAPFFIRKPSIDRQSGFASGLLSNPLSLGLLFSAPLIPSLLLTPLAIAGLSPAMSAINNFFGDDEEASTPASSNSPLSVLTGPSSPLSSFLQSSAAAQASGNSPGQSSPSSSFALQAMQTILGPPSTTERPLFNPGMFASQGIQNAIGSLGSTSGVSSSSASNSGGGSSSAGGLLQPSNSPIRNFLGGNLIQTAASMISPSFAAPPSSSSSSATSSADSDDGPGFMQVASDMFDKVANYMSPERDIAPAASGQSNSISQASGGPINPSSPLSALINLSSYSPFQLSSLFAASPFASAVGAPTSGGSSGSSSAGSSTGNQRAGFFSTLKNVYELFSSSFLRRQEVGDSNECQQRLICELHQRAMNSKLFRRSVQSNLLELAQLDRSIQEQLKQSNPLQARVDADTKAMLNDFLKATNNFKNGRELVNCSKMFPKCSRAMLLSAANAHLTDPANSKTIGKFSNLMKKMKFKSNQQHQNQWKLRKPNKVNAGVQLPRQLGQVQAANQYPTAAVDYLQVAPLSTVPNSAGKPAQVGQLTPADSLKFAQQIMLMSQQQQHQLQQSQQQQQQQQVGQQYAGGQQLPSFQFGNGNLNQNQNNQQQAMYSSPPQPVSSYQNSYGSAQFSQNGPQMGNIYTDAVLAPMYSSTDSPYYMQPQAAGNSSPDMANVQQVQVQQQQHPQHQNMQQQQQQQQVAQQLPNSYQPNPTSTSTMPDGHMSPVASSDKRAQQQQPVGITGGSVANAA